MEIVYQVKSIINKRKRLEVNDDYGADCLIDSEVQLLSQNLSETIHCLDILDENDFYWVSETFEKLSRFFKSEKLIECMKKNSERTKVDCNTEIEYAIKAMK